MKRIHQQRRAALRHTCKHYFDNQSQLAAHLRISRAYLSQLIGRHPTRNISDATARAFARRLKHYHTCR